MNSASRLRDGFNRRSCPSVSASKPAPSKVMVSPGDAEPGVIRSDWPVGLFSGEIFRHTFAGAEPSGSYRWLGYFTEPGTSNIIGLIGQAPFTFSP